VRVVASQRAGRGSPAARARPDSTWQSSAEKAICGRLAAQASEASASYIAAVTPGNQTTTETAPASATRPSRVSRSASSAGSRATPSATSSHPAGSARTSWPATRAESATMTSPIATDWSGFTGSS
jgi:hypothetical protein